ncbi:MAG: hypothetical protein LBJ24_09240 [Treponema sp.]|jgi:hypothetical protein|nr:hypothetical protein [Treponema sp.]
MGLLSKAAPLEEPEERPKGGGLLQKALAKETVPGAMGQALRDRIFRLARTKSSPYTALSLLKAYASFQAGLCVSLKAGVYHDYASVGLGIAKSAISQDILAHRKESFFKAGSAADLSLLSPKGDLVFWAFPLDKHEPCRAMLLLGGDDSFDPTSLAPIVHDVRELLSPPGESGAAEPELKAEPETGLEPETEPKPESESEPEPETDLFAAGRGIEEELVKFHTKNAQFQGIILDPPPNQAADFRAEIAESIAAFGTALALPARRCLALLPQNIDRELAAHRLTKEFHAACVFSFEADTPGRALELTRPYWQNGGTGS